MERILSLVRFPGLPAMVETHVVAFLNELASRGYAATAGRHRATMLSPCERMAVKVPHCGAGMEANDREARAWRRYVRDRRLLPIAGCRIFHADPSVGVPMLVMRRVDVHAREPRPDWASWIDCEQYGRDARGRMVAYDL